MAALLRVLAATAAGEGRALVVAAVEGSVPQAICKDIGFAAAEAVAVFGAAAPAAVSRAEPAVEVLGRAAPAPSARSLAHPAAEEDAEPSPRNARLLLGGGAGAPIISAPVPRRSHHVLRNSRALDAAAVGGRAGAGLRRRRDLLTRPALLSKPKSNPRSNSRAKTELRWERSLCIFHKI